MTASGDWRRWEGRLVLAIAAHSLAVGAILLFATRWGLSFGGFGEVTPLFFARQAGVFHVVVAIGYLLEHRRFGGVQLLLLAKAIAVLFLTSMVLLGERAWSLPVSAAADLLMGGLVLLVHARAARR